MLPLANLLLALIAFSQGPAGPVRGAGERQDSLPEIIPNDNATGAGQFRDGVLRLRLQATRGVWYPEKRDGPGHVVQAFAEAGRAPQIPGPMIRVPEGTEIRVTLENSLAQPLVVHGLYTRPGFPADTLQVPPGGAREVRFRAGSRGTYYYGASSSGLDLNDRYGDDSQLNGALIVDSRSSAAPADRVFVIGVWFDPRFVKGPRPLGTRRAVVVNGLSWPHTERFTFAAGDTVRWRWINSSDRLHPMHLHGSYFHIKSRGSLERDTAFVAGQEPQVVTETMPRGGTMTLVWVPDRPGRWMFHCHTLGHISPQLRLGRAPEDGVGQIHHAENHTLGVMSGLAVGVDVLPGTQYRTGEAAGRRRKLRLVAQARPGQYGTEPGLGFALEEPGAAKPFSIPGPPIILTRGQPVQLTVVNRLPGPTSVHWHGIELESYFDGMSGWSGDGSRTAPEIAPNDSFLVEFSPRRAGTFIYHTHLDEARQLSSGMYGALVVLEPGQRFNPETDHLLLFSRAGPARDAPMMLNGSTAPGLKLKAGRNHRLRLININPGGAFTASLLSGTTPIRWRAIAKDGADLPQAMATVRPARQMIGVGETYDFELLPEKSENLRLEVRDRDNLIISSVVTVR